MPNGQLRAAPIDRQTGETGGWRDVPGSSLWTYDRSTGRLTLILGEPLTFVLTWTGTTRGTWEATADGVCLERGSFLVLRY